MVQGQSSAVFLIRGAALFKSWPGPASVVPGRDSLFSPPVGHSYSAPGPTANTSGLQLAKLNIVSPSPRPWRPWALVSAPFRP
ncbi:Hypothetical protein NTJ_09730 [Nesidiocoris tenuis]|uniref:Uncharacterized protein n=1 Tax=Nesidiocoris tenuis TaxID=355587 RepID=A0ABN7AZT6_9HEMI|nr:Hypothetical protein NTJ_09730 [Nesidiocoris tenuis]